MTPPMATMMKTITTILNDYDDNEDATALLDTILDDDNCITPDNVCSVLPSLPPQRTPPGPLQPPATSPLLYCSMSPPTPAPPLQTTSMPMWKENDQHFWQSLLQV
eukprot:9574592-Ditylum_brightwellii.AAC.1